MKKRTPELYHGLIAFVTAFLYLLLVAPFVGGVTYIVATQIMIAGTALVLTAVIKADFKETFSIRLPTVRQFFGAVFTYIGIYFFTMFVSSIMMILFPIMADVIEGLSLLTEFMPHPVVAILVMAVMPAVCEELLMRGFILSSFSKLKPAVTIILVGVMFGILHFDPFRFVPTAILGMASAYIVLKTKSILLPMLYHLVNNTMSVVAMYQLNNMNGDGLSGLMDFDTVKAGHDAFMGLYLFFAWVFVFVGLRILNKKSKQ